MFSVVGRMKVVKGEDYPIVCTEEMGVEDLATRLPCE